MHSIQGNIHTENGSDRLTWTTQTVEGRVDRERIHPRIFQAALPRPPCKNQGC